MPWGRIIGATLLFEVAVALGFVLFVIPGVLVLVYCTLYGPAIVVERIGVRASLRRSAQLVRGNFRPMLALTAIVVIVGEGTAALTDVLLNGTEHWVHVLGFYVVDVLLTPLQGVGIAVAYFALVAIERAADVWRRTRRGPPKRAPRTTELPGSGSGLGPHLLHDGHTDGGQDEDDQELLHGGPSGTPTARLRRTR